MTFFSSYKLHRIFGRTFWILGFFVVSFVIIGAGIAFGKVRIAFKPEASVLGEAVKTSNAVPLAIEMVGANNMADGKSLGSSWPGEIVSLGDLEIQPIREGTIVEWYVGVGQKVRRGQAVARLSPPPASPDITKMLAEQAQMVSEARTEAAAMASFAEKNKKQLLALRASLEKNKNDVGSILSKGAASVTSSRGLVTGYADAATDRARETATIKLGKVRTIIERSVANEFPEIAIYPKDPFASFRATGYFTTSFNPTIGVLDTTVRFEYTAATIKLLTELKDPSVIPEAAANAYFQAANRVVLASISSADMPDSDLSALRKMISEDKTDFAMALADAREAKTDIAMKETEAKMKETDVKMSDVDYAMDRTDKEKDFAMQKKEIDEKIAMLERDVDLARGKARAAEVSYGTVVRGLTEGLNIAAPRDGVVSVIMKKNGDFVSPGMPVASLNSGKASERFVRFRIPSNLQAPEPGSVLTINRPGFPTDVKTVKLVGIGTALDENGSYVADADFVDEMDWPVRASVRVMSSTSDSLENFIPLTAIWWGEDGGANVWIVENGILHARKVITGRALADSIEVTDGLKNGESYVSKPLPNLKDGMPATGSTGSGGSTGTDMHGGMDMN